MLITALVAVFVLISLGLVVTVPVALDTPGEWDAAKPTFNRAFQLWIGLVLVIAIADGIATSI